MSTDDVDLAALRAVTSDLADALAGVEERDWVLPTPCAEWTLRDLVDHVVGGNWYTAKILDGRTSDDALAATMAGFSGAPVSAATVVRSAVDQLAAFERSGALDRSWNHVAGELPGRQILRLRLHDLIVHTWDIKQARRPPATVPASLAAWGLGELRTPGSLMAEHFDIPPAPAPAPEGPHRRDDPASTYLQAFGRSAPRDVGGMRDG